MWANPLRTGRRHPYAPRMRGIARVAAALVLVASAAACTADDVASTPSGTETSTPPAGMDESLRDAALDLLEQREQALVSGDRDAFLATVDEDELTFAATQARWFDNLARLPVTDLSLTLGDEGDMSRVHGEGALQLPVELTMAPTGSTATPSPSRSSTRSTGTATRPSWPTTATSGTTPRTAGSRPRGTSRGSRCAETVRSSASSTRTRWRTPTR